MRHQHGFTLLELLMVVIIIAILAAVALPQYIKATEKARAAEAFQILGAIRSSEQRYKSTSETGKFTSEHDELDTIDLVNVVTTKNWGTIDRAGLTLTDLSAALTRTKGPFMGEVLGLVHLDGTICGGFAVKTGIDLAAPACP